MGNEENKQVPPVRPIDEQQPVQPVQPSQPVVSVEQVQQEGVEQAKSEAARQAELQRNLQEQELKKQQEFQAQQKALEEQRAKQKQEEEEKLKKEIEEANATSEGGASGFKRFLGFLLLAFFIAFVIFLPQITDFINLKISERNQEEITSGRLICTSTRETSNLDVSMEAEFNFINNEIIKLTYTTTYTGDAREDKEELQKYNQECTKLKDVVLEYDGISASCSLNNGVSVQKQVFDYEKLDETEVSSVYTEAGGIYPEYKKGDKISGIESKMVSSGYDCKKVK